ncbi:MAG: PLD nuclease N-terminal domain-containing protein [Cyclobacteriaceae bacterium]
MISTLLFGMPGTTEWIIILLFGLIPLICIVDIMNSRFREPAMKWVWCALVVFFPLGGSLLYYWIGRNQRLIA